MLKNVEIKDKEVLLKYISMPTKSMKTERGGSFMETPQLSQQ